MESWTKGLIFGVILFGWMGLAGVGASVSDPLTSQPIPSTRGTNSSKELAHPNHRPRLEASAQGDFMSGSQIWIEGNSSLHRYYFTAEGVSAQSDLKTNSGIKVLLDLILHGGHQLTVTLPVTSLKSGDKGMDQNAYEKLKSKDFPDIVFTLDHYVVKAFPGSLNTYGLLVFGRLKIAGVEKDIVLEPTLVFGRDGIKIYGSQDISQKDYGISPYSVAVVMTTDDKIVVHYLIALGSKQKTKSHAPGPPSSELKR